MVWEHKPSSRPENSILLKIGDVVPIPTSYGFSARIIEGPKAMLGNRHRFASPSIYDCTGIGADAGYVVISSTPIRDRASDQNDARLFLATYSYDESWRNWIGRLFGWSSWAYPGRRIEPSLEP
ncbi:hypothetical protein [Alteriqipengyuania sp.]|uniref:hypothetical protein n=1 Tax=Alteriqipengyuania sp. TaxID=2800692 RepID=UPI00355A049D